MRLRFSLRDWVEDLLPNTTAAARGAARGLLRGLLCQYSTRLVDLARQSDYSENARTARQFFTRWLGRRHWQPQEIYTRLQPYVRHLLADRRGSVVLLVDTTFLQNRWAVLQVSVVWQGRALPLYRVVSRWEDPEEGQRALLLQALVWMARHLPGRRRRYILVMDRGFPSHELIRKLHQEGWRFVLRIKGNWKMTVADYAGAVAAGPWQQPLQLFRDVELGSRNKGEGTRIRHSVADVVRALDPHAKEPWYLVTNLATAAAAVATYAERMKIEEEFRDLKGHLGLDHLAAWTDEARVARLLAWIAVYEWWLAFQWLKHALSEWGRKQQVGGRLSWITVVRLWIGRKIRDQGAVVLDGL